jgi:phospholipid-binding lipoprotein MlaA
MIKIRCLMISILFFSLACSTLQAAETSTTTQITKNPHSIRDPENLTAKDADVLPPDDSVQPIDSSDPLGGLNHVTYQFNDFLYKAILKPTDILYNKILPGPLRQGVTNFFNNIDNLPTIVNDLLQTNFYQALSDTWRLFINTTIGIFGLFDVASRIGLEQNHEDFGLTLAYWGYKDSTYLIVPFFGPGTVRDIIGWPVDYFFFSIYPHIRDTKVRYSIYGLGVVSRSASLLQYQEVFEEAAVDKYGFMRSAYLQHRRYQIERNKELGDPYIPTGNEF